MKKKHTSILKTKHVVNNLANLITYVGPRTKRSFTLHPQCAVGIRLKNETINGHSVFVFDENSVREITSFSRAVLVFAKIRFQNKYFPFKRKRKAAIFKFLRFEERFRDGLRPAVERSCVFKFLRRSEASKMRWTNDLPWIVVDKCSRDVLLNKPWQYPLFPRQPVCNITSLFTSLNNYQPEFPP